ncbi:MAG: hypothetical protein WDW36_001671 [Sanguina aurantia]
MLLLSRGASARRGVVARSRRSSPSPGLTGGRGECGAAAAFPETLPKAREGVLQEGEGPGDVGRDLDDLLPAEQAPLQPAVQALVGEVLLHDPEGGGGGVGGGLSPGGGGRGCRCEGGGGGEGVGLRGSGAEGLALWPRNCERGGGAWIAPTPNNTCPGAAAAADGAGHGRSCVGGGVGWRGGGCAWVVRGGWCVVVVAGRLRGGCVVAGGVP